MSQVLLTFAIFIGVVLISVVLVAGTIALAWGVSAFSQLLEKRQLAASSAGVEFERRRRKLAARWAHAASGSGRG